MHQRKSKKILIYFFLLLVVSSIGNFSLNNLKFNQIQNIKISGLDKKNNELLFNKFQNLIKENIFFIDKNEITKLINSNSLIEKYEVFKKYPSTISINVEKTNFFAKINSDGNFYLIGSNGKLTPVEDFNYELPYIFGKLNIKEIFKFKQIIDKSKLKYERIESLFFFPSNRWDIKLKGNVLLKLPNNLTYEKLDRLYEFLKNNDRKNFSVVDYRIENQIILNE